MKNQLFLLFVITIIFSSCTKKSGSELPDIDRHNAILSEVFDAATVGVVSASDPLRFVLKEPVSQLPEGIKWSDVITLSPQADGEVTFSNNLVLTYTPGNTLQPDKTYKVTLNLSKLDPAKYKKAIEYEIRTLKQDMKVDREGFVINDDGSVSMLILVKTADKVRTESLLKCFTSDADETDILEVADHQYQLDFRFQKGMNKNSFIRYDGKNIYCEVAGDISLFDVDTGRFGVVYTHFDQQERAFNIYLSQKISRQADISGLVRVMGNPANFSIKNNVLTVHLAQQRNNNKIAISLDQAIRSESGKTLVSPYSFEVDSRVDMPELAFVGEGNYFPSDGDFKIPVKTRALESIRLFIVEIKQENVQHFLAWQSLNYVDFYNIRLYGKPVYDKEVKLQNGAPDEEGWMVYGIDLSGHIKRNPGSIYYITMEFGPHNTTLGCKKELKKYKWHDKIPDGQFFSSRDYYFNDYYYHEDYDWNETSDPCSISYYMNTYPSQKVFICSDFSIIAKKAGNNFHVALNKLMDLSSVGDADVTLYDLQAQSLGTARTDSKGFADFSGLAYEPAVLKVTKGAQITYLPLENAESNSLTEFDISGDRSAEDSEFFVYTDRDVWRPGDSIYVDVMINKSYSQLPPGVPLVLSFFNQENLLLNEIVQPIHVERQKIYSFTLHTPLNAKTGVYRCLIKAGPATLRKNIRVETIKPNNAETLFSFDKFSDNTIYSSRISGSLKFQYLTGYAVKGAKIKTTARARKIQQPFADYKEYFFDRYIFNNSHSFELPEMVTGDNGKAEIKASEDLKLLNGMLNVSLETDAILPGGGTNKEGKSVKLSPFVSYIGTLRKPGSGWAGNHNFTENIDIDLVNINEKGKLSINANTIDYTLQKNISYWWVDKYRLRTSGAFISDNYWEEISTDSKKITGKGKVTFTKGSLQQGAYRVIFTDGTSGHQSEVYFSVYDGVSGIPGTQPYILEFQTEKDAYTAGEDIKINFPDIKDAKILLSIERGNKLIQKQWVELSAGKTTVSIRSDESWTPNVYIHATMVQPYKQTNNDLPLRMYGVRHIKMDGKKSPLKPVSTLPAKLESEKIYNFTVSESEGRPMEYTIAIVDEGLLSLTGFSTPDPHRHFNGKYPLLVRTWDVYKYLINYFKGQFAGILSIGGDDAYNPDAIAEINRFKPVAIHMGPFKADAGKKVSHSVTIPNYIGKLRVMIVACNDDNFGKAEQFIPVKNPLMVQSQFPRALNVSDKLQLPVTILRDDNSINNVTLSVKADNTLVKGFNPALTLAFAGKDQLRHLYNIEVLNKTGKLDIDMEVSGSGKSMKEQTSLLIHYPNAYSSESENHVIASGEKLDLKVQPKGYTEAFKSRITISGMKVPDFTRYADELIEYPYGCLEQTTSTGFGQLYLDKVISLAPDMNRKRTENLQTAIQKISTFQKANGRFNYWENEYYHSWSDIYAAHFLVECQRLNYLGYDSDMIKKWVTAHTDIANKWAAAELTSTYTYESESLAQAYRLYILAKASRPAKSAMNRFVSGSKSAHPLVWWFMAGTFKMSGYETKAKEMIAKAEEMTKSFKSGNDYNSFAEEGRDLAVVVEVLSLFDDEKQKTAAYYDRMVDVLNQSNWTSTQTKGYAFMAAYKYFGKNLGITGRVSYSVSIGGAVKSYDKNAFEPLVITLNPGDLNKAIVIENKGTGPLHLVRSDMYIDNQLFKPASSENLGISVYYTNLTQGSRGVDQSRIGDDIQITVNVSNPSAIGMENLALNVKMPSGWELLNPRMYATEEQTKNPNYSYQDFRDDRVYTFFNLGPGKTSQFIFRAKAAFTGDFFRPAVSCEHMYKGNIYARTETQRIKVAE